MPRKPNQKQDPFWKGAKKERIQKPKRKPTQSAKKQLQSSQEQKEKQVQRKRKLSSEEPIRLNRFIAQAGICSRREADSLIAQGEIKVNGKVVTELGLKIVPAKDIVSYQGRILEPENKVYVLLNKPKNFITTTDDPEGRRTVLDLVKNATEERIFPVGRLDRMTTGLLLLTNDGDLTKKLTHPSHEIKKLYHVKLNQEVSEEHIKQLRDGVELEDGMAAADKIRYVEGKGHDEVGIELHIGRNRIVRRMFEALGYEVERLDRVMFGSLTKKNLPRGKWRMLSEREVSFLKMQTGGSKEPGAPSNRKFKKKRK
ncbi:MAG: pseudouridine synthase [Bacteroidota bacterium]